MLYISTKLDAINIILASIGESPINTLTGSQSIDVDNAITMLDNVSREVQGKGWTFNTHSEMAVSPDANSNKIRYNPTWIKFESTDGNTYVKRGDYLYNLTDETFTFTKNITLKIIEAVDFEDLIDCFKSYITTKAASRFQARFYGDGDLSNEILTEEAEALAEVTQYCIDTGSNVFQITGMQSMLERR